MFQLTEITVVTLKHINMRTEKHGPSDIDAYDLDFMIERGNSDVLPMLDPHLLKAFYFLSKDTAKQAEVEGITPILPNLRFPKMGPISWPDELDGVDLFVMWGTGDERSNIKLEGGTLSSKKVELVEGGTTRLYFQFSTSNMPDGVLDKLRKKQKQELSITAIAPEKQIRQAVIDGTVGHPGAAKPTKAAQKKAKQDATDAFVAGAAEATP